MTNDDAIKWLENLKQDIGQISHENLWHYAQVIDEICGLLKEQEPIEPKVDVDEWRCGNCGHKLEYQELLGENVLFHEQYSYCPQCGKAVKWGG